MLIGCRETLVGDRARGLVGYDVALTRRRSPVRIRPGPWYFNLFFLKIGFEKFLFHSYEIQDAGMMKKGRVPVFPSNACTER